MSIDVGQFRDLTQRVLIDFGKHSAEAVELLMLTAATESSLGTYIRQSRKGPALGVMQMEVATHDDIWVNYLGYREELGNKVLFAAGMGNGPDVRCLEYNLAYSIAMARVHYLRVPEPLPKASDIEGMARYWKAHYNSKLGKGTVEKAVEAYLSLCV